jgi:hypothetical protein
MVGGTPAHGSGLAAAASCQAGWERYLGLPNRTFVRLRGAKPLEIGRFVATAQREKANEAGHVMVGQLL